MKMIFYISFVAMLLVVEMEVCCDRCNSAAARQKLRPLKKHNNGQYF